MGKTNNLYSMMRLSFEQALDDYANKKNTSLVDAYSKHYRINVGMECYDPHGDLINFYDEDNSQESII
jgi:hypothetical protein|tara:strand:+ start:777 stop:980 length:204 start_codon:yes stop_codon:yes gene_type:complete